MQYTTITPEDVLATLTGYISTVLGPSTCKRISELDDEDLKLLGLFIEKIANGKNRGA